MLYGCGWALQGSSRRHITRIIIIIVVVEMKKMPSPRGCTLFISCGIAKQREIDGDFITWSCSLDGGIKAGSGGPKTCWFPYKVGVGGCSFWHYIMEEEEVIYSCLWLLYGKRWKEDKDPPFRLS